MMDYHLPAQTRVGGVHLRVSDLERALAFYSDMMGFHQLRRRGATAALSATGQPPAVITLSELPGAQRKPARTTGLYHVAIRFPTREALARTFERLVAQRWPFQGAADHLVSEALYLADPDGNGLELYVDRPRGEWQYRNGQLAMATDPLDVEALLALAGKDPAPWTGVDPGTDIGHVHLQGSELGRAEAFYRGLLGLDVTQRSYPGALFVSAGSYHHHLGINTWAGVGAPPPPPDAVGLVSFALQLPERESWATLMARVRGAGIDVEREGQDDGTLRALIRDPDGTGVELVTGL